MGAESPHTFERRALIRAGAIGAAGLIFGYVSRPVERQIDGDVERFTDFTSGDLRGDEQRAKPSSLQDTAIQAGVEEVVFRAFPAFVASWRGKLRLDKPIKDVTFGVSNNQELVTRREVIAGGLSTLAYEVYSNITDAGSIPSFEKVPVSPAFRGIGLWVLQRKFGVVANTVANFLSKLG
jgi:hypothetical protein